MEAERKSEEARALIAKNEYDPAIELFAASLELRCVAPCHRAHRPPRRRAAAAAGCSGLYDARKASGLHRGRHRCFKLSSLSLTFIMPTSTSVLLAHPQVAQQA